MDDLIDGLIRLGTVTDAPDGPINLGNTLEVKIGDIAQRIINLTGTTSRVEYLPLPQDDPVRRRPDTTRAQEILDWEATTPLEIGLPSTIEYFRTIM